MSIQGLQQNPQDTTNFYLANIYQTLAEPNGSNTLTSPPSPPTPFSPPNTAVWVNAHWFLSLVISLTCALLATLLQQWARRYLKITQSRYTPHKRARIRAFFAEGVDKCLLPWTVDALPTLLHISLFLFFAGLVVFLCNVNLTIFKLVSSWVGLCTALYGCITCMPIICHHSPYYTPLSLPAWHILTWALFFIYGFLCWLTASLRFHYRALDNLCARALCRFQDLEESCHKSLVRGMQKTAEETALNLPSAIDTRAFMWTFDCLDEDHELEHFFAGLPSFRSSKVVKDPLPLLTEEERSKLYEGLHGLLNRTFLSDLLPAPVKNRRAIICTKAIDPEHTPNAFILHAISFKYQHSGPVATEIAKILRGHGNNMNQDNILRVRFAISKIIGTRQPFDDSWYNLASYELGFPETSLRDYAAHGDNFSFLILIYLVRQQFTHFGKSSWPEYDFSFVLATASTFNVKDSSPKLQHEFCTLWNEIVRTAQPRNDGRMASFILGRIRSVFLSLHQDTNSAPTQFSTSTGDEDDILWDPSSYPQCKVPDHHSYSTPQIHDNDASLIRTCAIRHGHDNTAFVPFIATPDPTSSFTHAPLSVSVDETHTDVLPPDNQISVPVSTQVTDRTSTEGHRIPTISLSPVSTCAVHGNIDPSRMTQPSTSSPSHKSNASASPSAGIAVGRTELSHTPSGDLNVLSSPSPSTPVLDAILPTGALLFLGRDLI